MSEPINGTTYPPQPSQNVLMTQDIERLDLRELLIERGTTGLKRAGGYVREDMLSELQGQLAVRKYREMRDNSPVIGACLYAIEMLVRNVVWKMEPADETDEARHYADLMYAMIFDDMDLPWGMLVSEILSFLPFGFSYFEMIFKRRLGMDPPRHPDGTRPLQSQFNDGLIGLGKIAPRSQDTVLRWVFDSVGSLMGMHQLDPFTGHQAYLPREKCLLFRPTSYKDNPEGRSILRTAYRPWYLLSHIENTEGVGIERDLAGLPTFGVPPQWYSGSATPEEQAQLEMIKRIARNIRQDEQAGLVYPLIYDPSGNLLFKFELAHAGGAKAIDTDKIIQRYELRITQSMLCDLIFLGHEDVGSFALASSKSTTQAMSLGGYLRVIQDELNRRCIPLIWRLNAFPKAMMPHLEHGDVETVDLTELARFILSFGRIYPMADLENHIRSIAGFPERDNAANNPLPPAILPAGGGEGFHAHGGGLRTGTDVPTAIPGAGLPDLDRELSAPSI